MNRRTFLAVSVAATGGLTILDRFATASAEPKGPFAEVKLRMSVPLGIFEGDSVDEKLEDCAKWGLSAYEALNPPSGDPAAIRRKMDQLGLELSCTRGAGKIDTGWMVQPEDHDKTVAMFEKNVQLAKQLNCRHLVGLTGNERADVSRDQQTEYVVQCLKRLAPIAEKNDVILVVEMLNTFVNHKGYFLSRTDHGVQIIKAVNSPNVRLLFDIYHQQISEGNVIRNITENIGYIGHFHVADNPGRNEPGTGELNYTNIFKAIAATGYKEFVALECGSSTKNDTDILNATLSCLKQS